MNSSYNINDIMPGSRKLWTVRVPPPTGICLGCKKDYKSLDRGLSLNPCFDDNFVCSNCIDDFEWGDKGKYIRKEKEDG